ncbi:DUF1206 domain-containing protein [Nocardia fluminea]|uniref:DUF1206 domain-containing protein n=1 Tax=Nocardia fluminea TaxID=134984 RepID=UPI003646552B
MPDNTEFSASYDNSATAVARVAQNSTFERFARAGFVMSGVVHLLIGYVAVRIALGGAGGTADQSGAMTELAESTGITARMMHTTAGTIALVAAGLIIIAIGGYHVYKGATQSFLPDLKGATSTLVRRLGTVGYIAKGLAIAAIGALVIVAVIRSEPDEASGLDGAFKTLGAQPFGAVLLLAAGPGIITYGFYSFAMARYTKM